MSDGYINHVNVDKENQMIVCELEFKNVERNDQYELEIIQKVEVLRSRGVDEQKTVYARTVDVSYDGIQNVNIPLEDIEVYNYNGTDIKMNSILKLKKSNGFMSIFSGSEKEQIPLGSASTDETNKSEAKLMLNPPDRFDIVQNVKALSGKSKNLILINIAVFLFSIGYMLYIGWHDQNAASPDQVYIFPQYNSDGERQHPIIFIIVLSVGLLGLLIFWLRKILKRYMIFGFVNSQGDLERGKTHFLNLLVGGVSRVNLENCKLRIVACNIENGQYNTGSGKKKRTRSFSKPTKCVLIHEEDLPTIPKGRKLENIINSAFSFDKVYENLAPECMVSSSHGVKLHWEVQLLHPEFRDHEVVGSNDGFYFSQFVLD